MECVEECRIRLQNFHPFTPFGVARTHDDSLRLTGGFLMPDVDDPILYLYDMAYSGRNDYTAFAIVHDVQADERIRIYLEHVEDEAFRVRVPWLRLGDDNIRLEPPVIQSTEPLIWAEIRGSAR
jgi:hypothetical protein